MSRELATIALDAPLPEGIGDAARGAVQAALLEDFFERARIGPMTRRRALAQAGPGGSAIT